MFLEKQWNALSNLQIGWMLAGISGLFYLPFLGYVDLFDWDEINFAEISREMTVLGNYTRVTVNYLPFWEKPPLFFWLQAASMQVFGVNEFAARLPNALCGIITIPILFQIGTKLYDRKFGVIWALAYMGSILPGFYFQTGIIDPVFNLFIFLGLYFFILYYWKFAGFANVYLGKSHLWYLVWAGVFSGMAVLTKGPVGFLILMLCFGSYFVFKRFKIYFGVGQFLLYCIITLVVSSLWLGLETAVNGPWFLKEFIEYNIRLAQTEDAGHGGFPGYHFVIIFFGCFPASLFCLRAFRKLDYKFDFRRDFKNWMIILLSVILILFSIVQSKIVHYSSMAYFPVTFLASVVIYKVANREIRFPQWIGSVIKICSIFIGLMVIGLTYLGLNPEILTSKIADPFVLANLEANAGWTGLESLIGVILILISFISIRLINKSRISYGILIMFLGTALVVKLSSTILGSRVLSYSQEAAVEFFQSVADEEAYLHTVGYKTYVHYFYGRVKPSQKPDLEDRTNPNQSWEWQNHLMFGKIDIPVYFSTTIDKTDRFKDVPNLDSLYSKNGFVFYRRNPQKRIEL